MDDWLEHKKLILANQERTEKKVDKALEEVNNIKTSLAVMQVKIAGGVFLITALTSYVMKKVLG